MFELRTNQSPLLKVNYPASISFPGYNRPPYQRGRFKCHTYRDSDVRSLLLMGDDLGDAHVLILTVGHLGVGYGGGIYLGAFLSAMAQEIMFVFDGRGAARSSLIQSIFLRTPIAIKHMNAFVTGVELKSACRHFN